MDLDWVSRRRPRQDCHLARPRGILTPMWTVAGSGGDDKAHREFEAAWRRRQRPENEVPVSVAIDAVLADVQDVVVFISGARVFSNGVDFTLEVRARHGTNDGRGGMLGGVHGDGDPSNRLLRGVEFSDGRLAAGSMRLAGESLRGGVHAFHPTWLGCPNRSPNRSSRHQNPRRADESTPRQRHPAPPRLAPRMELHPQAARNRSVLITGRP